MMINPINIQPNAIDSSEKRKRQDRRDLPGKASHRAEEKTPANESSHTYREDKGGVEGNTEERTPRIDITV